MRKPKDILTDQELEIMKIVWEIGEPTVRDVYEKLRKRRSVAYTTVMTMMNILEQKGQLVKTSVDRAYKYKPAKPKNQVERRMVRDFVNRVFDGAAEPLLLHLVNDKKLSQADVDEIARILRRAK